MSYDEFCGEWYNPRSLAEYECPNCSKVWNLFFNDYEEKWIPQGGGFAQEEDPMINGKCPSCLLDEMTDAQLIGYAEEYDRRAMVLRGLLSTDGKPLPENDPVIEWAWESFKAYDPQPLAEAVKDTLYTERWRMIDYLRGLV